MRHATITRKRVKYIGRLIKYNCFLNVSREGFEKYLFEDKEDEHQSVHEFWVEVKERFLLEDSAKTFTIANGESVDVEISELQNEFFVVAFTSTGPSISNLQIINAGNLDVLYSIETDYSWTKGTKLTVIAGV